VTQCADCHSPGTLLTDGAHHDALTRSDNPDVLERYGYLLGANRMEGLDLAGLGLVAAALAFALGHGALRLLARGRMG
jgi:hypothetical protein